ncbi:MAG: hypothetical protein IJ244_02220 [Bacteroidaceae bacterium]|nr:hypothetical protein [Bacteroidaceae bacterium]
MSIGAWSQVEVCSDYWAATDGLGRKVGSYDAQKEDKQVLMFYWTWHERKDAPGTEVKNNTEIRQRYPEAMLDANHPAWTEKATGNYFWDEPLLGYYKTTDKWVLRKHAEMLADAKVDAVFFDCTNGSMTWDASTDSLLEVWDKARLDGVKVPKIAFMLPFGYSDWSLTSLRHLYERLYSKGLYRELWYMWNGKPCIMAYPDNLSDSPTDQAIRQFFTFRPGQPDYVDGPNPNFPNQWGWLENYPQHGYIPVEGGTYELVTVGVAQNACPETKGHCSAFNKPGAQTRSFSKRNGFDPRPDGYLYGWNFEEQWDRAYELNPKAVFITGWNEWIAGKYTRANSPWTGDPFSFVDEFDWDHSRDIEPVSSWGDKGDVYYMQLVDRVRKFKGTAEQPKPSQPVTIRPTQWQKWNDVRPIYSSYKGNTMHRYSEGPSQLLNVNISGRNDIVSSRVARDGEYIYFYVETAETLTPQSDHNWMLLLLDTDRNKQTGWQGYDYIVNYKSPRGHRAYVQRSYQNKWMWRDCGEARIDVTGNRLMLRIPRDVVGLTGSIDMEFKWSDNMQDEGNIMDFYVNGDVAPGGRFNYVYTAP